jgi:anti-sigma factor RsiW
MRKWQNDIRHLERYLFGWLKAEEQEVFERQLEQHPELKEQVEHQQTTYEAIRWYGRRKVRREIKNVHRRLITERPDSPLARHIRRLFS